MSEYLSERSPVGVERLLRHVRGADHARGRGRHGQRGRADVHRSGRGRAGRRTDSTRRPRPADLPQLRSGEQPHRTVLRSVWLRLHDRHDAASTRREPGTRGPGRGPDPARDADPSRVGRGAVGGPRLVRRTGEQRPVPFPRSTGRRTADQAECARGPALSEPQHPPGRRLLERLGCEPATGPADHRRPAVVGRGPAVLQRHLCGPGQRPVAERPRSPRTAARARRGRPGLLGTWTRLVVRRATPEEQAGEAS